MLSWMAQNLGNILVGAAVLAIAVLAFIKTRRDQKKGGCAGCSGCSGCAAGQGSCHAEKRP